MIGLIDTIMRARLTESQTVGRDRFVFPFRQAGIVVNHDIALTYSTVWACVRLISETLASVPWQVNQRKDGRRERVPNHHVDRLLNVRANAEMTAFDFKQTIIAHVLLWGNGYAEIDRSPSGQVINLWPLSPDQVTPVRDADGRLVYEVRQERGGPIILQANDVLHFRGLGFDGLQGYSVVRMASQAIGLGLATQQFGSDFFSNGAHASGVLEHPAKLKEDVYDRLKTSLREAVGRAGKWMNPLILEDGIKWTRIGVPPDDAQFLETREFQSIEIARMFRVPPHKIGDLKRATFDNISMQSVEFVTDTITPWAVRFENEADIKLLPRRQNAQGLFIRINLMALLRGDVKTRFEAYRIGREWGWLSANDIRALEDMNPIDEDQGGNVFIVPANFQSTSRLLLPPAPSAGALPAPSREGPEGARGPVGPEGAPGKDGKDGAGERGLAGVPGAKGETGEHGAEGKQGSAGPEGVGIGLPGPSGKAGERGESGQDGKAGRMGQQGTAGEAGSRGEAGKSGERGKDGLQGIAGKDGRAGKLGPAGDTGDRGDRGAVGGQGRPGECGAAGKAGGTGPEGRSGVPGKPYGPAMRNMAEEVVGRLYRRERAKIGDLMKGVKKEEFKIRCRKFYAKHQTVMAEEVTRTIISLDMVANGRKAGPDRERTIANVVAMWCEARCARSLEQLTADGGSETLKAWAINREANDVQSLIDKFAPIMLFGA